jgi:hypothetical protein
MKQVTIICDDRPGVVANISEALAAADVNIESLDAETIGDSVVARLTVDKYDAALQALTQASFQAISDEAIVVRIDDAPGELARVTCRFKDANVNLNSVRIIRRADGKSFVAIGAANIDEASALVRDLIIS